MTRRAQGERFCHVPRRAQTTLDRCTRADQRYLLADLRSKDADYRGRLAAADHEVTAGRGVRLRSTRRGLVRIAA